MACPEFLARTALGKAIATGRILRPNQCEGCGDIARVQGHHHDYSRRLDVTWLCRKCHYGVHVAIRRGHLALSESRQWILDHMKTKHPDYVEREG